MKVLNIGGKDYKIMFTFEAALYKECTEKVTDLILGIAEGTATESLSVLKSSMSDIPGATIIMFHAGLMEENPTNDIAETKELLKQYFRENKDHETGNFYGFMQLLLECMGDDGFFKQIGLEQLSQTKEETEENTVAITQDYKRKTKRISDKS